MKWLETMVGIDHSKNMTRLTVVVYAMQVDISIDVNVVRLSFFMHTQLTLIFFS